MPPKLSAQAKTWLDFFYLHPEVRINYQAIMEYGPVSRRKSLEIIRELRAAKMITAKRSRYVGTNLELTTMVSSVTTVTAVQPISHISNSYIASTSSNATYFFDEVEEEGPSVGYEFFESTSGPDDSELRERAKHMAAKKAEYAEARETKAQQRKDVHRSKIDPVNWNSKDVAYEFADRMSNYWNIKPFSVTQSRFVQALGVFRKQHDTDGALELKMIDMFFSSLQAEKYNDGNHLWRAFLYKAPTLLQSAREQVVSAEDVQTAIIADSERTAKKLRLLEEDDV